MRCPTQFGEDSGPVLRAGVGVPHVQCVGAPDNLNGWG